MENRVMNALGCLRRSWMPMFCLLNPAYNMSPFGWRSGHSPRPPVRDGGHLLPVSRNLSRLPFPSLHLILTYSFSFLLPLLPRGFATARAAICILSPRLLLPSKQQQLRKNRFSPSFSGNHNFQPECYLHGKKEIRDPPVLLVSTDSAFPLTICSARGCYTAPGTAVP